MDDRHVMRLIKASERIAASLERISDTLAKQVQLDTDMRHVMDVVMQAETGTSGTATIGDPMTTTQTVDPNYVKPPEWMTR